MSGLKRRASLQSVSAYLLVLVEVAWAPVSVGYAQSITGASTIPNAGAPSGPYRTLEQISPLLLQPFLAMGDRLTKPGKERITIVGTMTDSSGANAVQVVLELGGKLNITWTAQGPQRLAFNGTAASSAGSITDANDLLESFVDDSPEALLLAGRGASPRLLGQKFENPSGGLCDYYDVATYGRAVKRTTPQIKRYCFDSKTSLLRSVRYKNSSGTILTEFGNWGTVNNEAVPGTITRIVGGNQVFHFQAQSSVVSASIPDNIFNP